jgi:ABC-type Co2+ transport system permease subunit
MILSYATAVGVAGVGARLALESIKKSGAISLALKSLLATIIVFCSFEVLPHYPIGISEVHLILGTTIFLIFGIAPAMIGLALGLLVQGIFFAQFDLPQYGINVTTLLASMLVLDYASKRIIPKDIAYKDISYSQMLKLSLVWEGMIVSWVAFWAFYGQGFTAQNIHSVTIFGSAYMLVVIIEPLVDLAVLSAIKAFNKSGCSILFYRILNNSNI